MLGKRTSKKPSDRAALRNRALRVVESTGGPDPLPPPLAGPIDPLFDHDSLGAALKAIREAKKLSLQEVADLTRVRRAYLEAIEAMDMEKLPSRPFTIGYIRAYAAMLGADPDMAIDRFKTDEPVLEAQLQAPVGVPEERDPRVAAFLIGAVVIVSAIVLWNVAQRSMSASAPPPPLAAQATVEKALRSMKPQTMELGAPLPAPVESTTPAPYETPGLAASMGLQANADAPRPKAVNEGTEVDLATLPTTFRPMGKVYDSGNPQLSSAVTLQALKNAALILRGADGSVYFARQLSKGEAFRAPRLPGLTIDVSNANDFQVFVDGQSKGVLPATQVLASKLATAPTVAAPAAVAPAAAAPVSPPPARPPPKAPAG
ncbi:helix-turn-helix domain-containing protein [uncultured Phenylobacterium sp.]|uniref:helix-turn-helix domain-containing protein n=1 Tax=uncultured Phenylobacterium sp. TaxID=349273 RepID=UPI0025EB17EC|nr:helix-turn-helix domain-containing protein [uncultured Phenylobacterium sp.]